jgi:hypothetical protein
MKRQTKMNLITMKEDRKKIKRSRREIERLIISLAYLQLPRREEVEKGETFIVTDMGGGVGAGGGGGGGRYEMIIIGMICALLHEPRRVCEKREQKR